MTIQEIKKANAIVKELDSVQEKLKELSKSHRIDYISIVRYQSGADKYSYNVSLRNEEFLNTMKSLITDFLKREEKKLIKEIEKL